MLSLQNNIQKQTTKTEKRKKGVVHFVFLQLRSPLPSFLQGNFFVYSQAVYNSTCTSRLQILGGGLCWSTVRVQDLLVVCKAYSFEEKKNFFLNFKNKTTQPKYNNNISNIFDAYCIVKKQCCCVFPKLNMCSRQRSFSQLVLS